MAKVDSSWVFVQPRTSRSPAPSGQRLVRPKSSMALQYHDRELSPETSISPSGLLWRDARWMYNSGRASTRSVAGCRLSLGIGENGEIIDNTDAGNAIVVPKRMVHVNEQQKFVEYAQKVRHSMNLNDILDFLEDLPVASLIEAIPHSMPLLEALYTKFYLCDKRKFPVTMLKPETLLTQLLWWVAYQEHPTADPIGQPDGVVTVGQGSQRSRRENKDTVRGLPRSEPASEPNLQWQVMVPHVRNILRIILAAAPEVMESMRKEQNRVERALEGLGLHGLVNCGQNKLINVTDAVRLEVSAHYHLVKGMSHQLEKLVQKAQKHENPMTMFLYSINGEGNAPIPSKCSHQRLMSLRLSYIRERLNKNEFTLQILRAAMRNPDLESLERILQKRIIYDQEIVYQFNILRNDSNPNYSIIGEDPIVVEILVQFRRAYDKLLGLLPAAPSGRSGAGSSPGSVRDDSGLGEDEEDGSGGSCSSPEFLGLESHNGTHSSSHEKVLGDLPALEQSTFNERRTLSSNRSSRLLGPVAHLIKSKSKRFHRSLAEIDQNNRSSLAISPEKSRSPVISNNQEENIDLSASSGIGLIGSNSLAHLSISAHHTTENPENICFEEVETDMYFQQEKNRITNPEKMETNRLKAEINRLSSELSIANKRIIQLSPDRFDSDINQNQNSSLPKRSFETLPQHYAKPNNIILPNDGPVQKFNSLFTKDRLEIMNQLKQLPELNNSEELQAKIIFSVVVLSFRSVQDSIEKQKEKVWDILNISNPEKSEESITNDFENSLYRFLSQRAKLESGMKNAKEVTSKIWQTLYDFPSLKTCTRFNRFILDCVQVAWDLTAGVDGEPPRFRLEYESSKCDSNKHLRYQNSSLRSDEIKRYVWPGLLLFDENTKSESDVILSKGVVLT